MGGGGSKRSRAVVPKASEQKKKEETPVQFIGNEAGDELEAKSAVAVRPAEPATSIAIADAAVPSIFIENPRHRPDIQDKYINDLFQAYSINAALDAASLTRMIADMRSHTGSGGETTLEDGEFVVSWMDTDGDKSISLDEFSSWLNAGLRKSDAMLDEIASKGDRGKRLVDFLQAIISDMSSQNSRQKSPSEGAQSKKRVTTQSSEGTEKNALGIPPFPKLPKREMCSMWIQDTFRHYDTNGDDRLDASELFQLCAHVKQWALKSDRLGEKGTEVRDSLEDFSPRDASMVLRIIDKDRDGSIDCAEFTDWIIRGLDKTDSDMAKVMEKNASAAKMVALVVAIRICLTDYTNKRSDLETSLIDLFLQYDKDNSGALSKEELLGMMRVIEDTARKVNKSNDHEVAADAAIMCQGGSLITTEEDVDFIMQCMDSDGSGTLEKKEWLAWLRVGLAKTDDDLSKLPKERLGLARFIKRLRKYLALQASSYVFFASTPFESEMQKLFERFDNPGEKPSGQLLPSQFLNLMTTVLQESSVPASGPVPTQEDADFVVSKMDIDGDGYVSLPEFIAWVETGLEKSSKDLDKLAHISKRHAGLVNFLRCLQNSFNEDSKTVAEEYKALSKKIQTAGAGTTSLYPPGKMSAPLRVRISRLFSDYDADGNQSINVSEMLAVSPTMPPVSCFRTPLPSLRSTRKLAVSNNTSLLKLLLLNAYILIFFEQLLIEVGCYLPYDFIQNALGGKPIVWSKSDAAIITETLDQDGNGTIEREEFIDWISAGLRKMRENSQLIQSLLGGDEFSKKRACFLVALSSYLGSEI